MALLAWSWLILVACHNRARDLVALCMSVVSPKPACSTCVTCNVAHSSKPKMRLSDRPCLVDNLMHDVAWTWLPENMLISRTVVALQAWCSQVDVSMHTASRLESLVRSNLLQEANLSETCLDMCLLRCAAVALNVCDDAVLAKVMSHQLSIVTRGMVDWMLPPSVKTKKKTSLDFDRLLQVVGCVRMLLHTRWQALGGRMRQKWAKHRLQCLHPSLAAALFQQGPLSVLGCRACAHFLGVQLSCAWLNSQKQGVMYMLCSPRQSYLGSTSCGRVVRRCGMTAVMPRYYEHLHEIRGVQRNVAYAQRLCKTRVFKSCHLGDLAMWVACVSELPLARAMEQCFLRAGHWPANSSGTCRSQKPTRHSPASRAAGRRPPPRFRRHGADTSTFVGHVCARAACLARTCHNTQELQTDAKYLQQAFDLPFTAAYWHVCRHRFARDGTFGPVDLRSKNAEALFARYVCEQDVCWESIRHRWCLCAEPAGCEAIVALLALRRQPSCYARAKGIKACNRLLRRHGLPGTVKHRVRWPASIPRRVFFSCVRDVRKSLLQSCSPLLATWLADSCEAVVPRGCTYTRLWNHIRICRERTDAAWFDMLPEQLQLTLDEGASMQLRKLYWKTPVWQTPADASRQAQSAMFAWARLLPPLPDRCWVRHIHGWCHKLGYPKAPNGLDRHFRYTCQLVVPEGFAAVQEDKDKSSCWTMPAHVYCKLFALMVNQDTYHWVRVHVLPEEVVEQYRQQHVSKLPPYMTHFGSHSRWKNWRLPYMYVNVKSKCFDSGVGRICNKLGHACCRRVVSWAKHPCRWLYKQNARAMEASVRLWGQGLETRDLSTAVSDFRAAVNNLKHEHGCLSTCHRCGEPKPSLCLWVGDAAQLFEEVARDEVLLRLKHILRDLEASTGGYAVVTRKNRRLHYWVARNNFRPSLGAKLHRWQEIEDIAQLALSQIAVNVGPTVYEQCRGVPIGGFMSKQFASVFLGFAESRWAQAASSKTCAEWIPQYMSFSETVAATRYVDDLALASSALCAACLGSLTTRIYEPPIQFEETKPTEYGLPWLDVWLSASGLNLYVCAHGVESRWRDEAAVGNFQFPVKYRMMPFQGTEVLNEFLLAAQLSGRLQRLKSLHLDAQSMRSAIRCELQLWVLHGYPLSVIDNIWKKGRHYPEALTYARELLRQAMQTCGRDACAHMPWDRVEGAPGS